MRPSLRVISPLVFFPVVGGLLSVPGVAWAQSQLKPAESAKSQSASGPGKPTHKPDWVANNDSIVRLAVRQVPSSVEALAAEPATVANDAAKEAGGTAEDPVNKAAEIAAVEKQIQDKQKKIALLMRLFVNDERSFLNNPSDPGADAAVQERRKYEQDELLYESAEIARLRTRLKRLVSTGGEKAAEDNP